MTKKDYDMIAEILQRNMCTKQIVVEFADALEKENPKFDRKKFYKMVNPYAFREELKAPWVVVNVENLCYWSNKFGWMDGYEAYKYADKFTDSERKAYNLPIDGRWTL